MQTLSPEKNEAPKTRHGFDNRVAPGSEVTYLLSFPYAIGEVQRTLFLAGETDCRPDYDCKFENPAHACILYAAKGNGTFLVEGRRCELPAGSMILLREGIPWRFYTDEKDPWQLFWVNLQAPFLLEMLSFYALPHGALFRDDELSLCFMKLFDRIRDTEKGFRERRDLAIRQLLRLVQSFEIMLSDRENNTPAARDASRVADYINAHIMEDIRVSELARLVFRSTYSLSTIFKSRYGCNPKEYILEAKCEIATRLLRENNRTVSEIADMLSFCDAQHFSQVFRRRFGMSPSAFRQASMENKEK